MSRKLTCQLKYWPMTRPSGIPITIAITVPVLSRPKAWLPLPCGATRTASEAVIDQNTACVSAIPIRLSSRISKFHARNDTAWLAVNSANSTSSRRRRSKFLVASISGSDSSATIHA